MKKFFFQIHWFFGITAGLIIAIVGVTGGMLSLQPQILQWLNPGVVTVEAEGEALSPATLIQAVQQQKTESQIAGLTLYADPQLAAQVVYAPEPGQRRGATEYLNPYSGELLGQAAGKEFFFAVMRLHRWLLIDDITIGRPIVGAATVILIFLAISGIYFRWPKGKKKYSPKFWFTLRFGRMNRSFWWQLHAVVGTWLLPVYLLACLTGLYWSYDWYRNALFNLAGVEQSARSAPDNKTNTMAATASELDQVWQYFVKTVPDYTQATLQLPVTDTAQFSYFDAQAAHDRARNSLQLNVANGDTITQQLYAEKKTGEKLMSSILPLHTGSFFGWPGLIIFMLGSLLMPLFFITGWYLYLTRRRARK